MVQTRKINIPKQIIIEKSNFISNNSTYFNQTLSDNLPLLKNILLNNAPLTQCEEYEEIIKEIKKSKIKNNAGLNYQNSIEILFAIIYSLLHNVFTSEESKHEQIETIRHYVRCVSTHNSGKIYYHNQKIISVDNNKLELIENKIKNEKKQKQYIKNREL